MTCPKCGSENCTIQLIQEKPKKSALWWCLVGWWWIPIKWMLFGIFALFMKPKKQNVSMGICQSCGYNWKIEN